MTGAVGTGAPPAAKASTPESKAPERTRTFQRKVSTYVMGGDIY